MRGRTSVNKPVESKFRVKGVARRRLVHQVYEPERRAWQSTQAFGHLRDIPVILPAVLPADLDFLLGRTAVNTDNEVPIRYPFSGTMNAPEQ
jgi:hypothetical protein